MRATLLLVGVLVIGVVAAGSAAAVGASGGQCLPGGGSLGSRLDVVDACICLDGPSLSVDSNCSVIRP